MRDGFVFRFYVDYTESDYGGSFYTYLNVSYQYLVGWFEMNESGQCYSGYFNGFNANNGNNNNEYIGGGTVIVPGGNGMGGIIVDRVEEKYH